MTASTRWALNQVPATSVPRFRGSDLTPSYERLANKSSDRTLESVTSSPHRFGVLNDLIGVSQWKTTQGSLFCLVRALSKHLSPSKPVTTTPVNGNESTSHSHWSSDESSQLNSSQSFSDQLTPGNTELNDQLKPPGSLVSTCSTAISTVAWGTVVGYCRMTSVTVRNGVSFRETPSNIV